VYRTDSAKTDAKSRVGEVKLGIACDRPYDNGASAAMA
jgi:hypothetical protein